MMLVDTVVEKGIGTSRSGQLCRDFQPMPPGLPGLQPKENLSLNTNGRRAPKQTSALSAQKLSNSCPSVCPFVPQIHEGKTDPALNQLCAPVYTVQRLHAHHTTHGMCHGIGCTNRKVGKWLFNIIILRFSPT